MGKFKDALTSLVRSSARDVADSLSSYYVSVVQQDLGSGNYQLSNGKIAVAINGGRCSVGDSVLIMAAGNGNHYIFYWPSYSELTGMADTGPIFKATPESPEFWRWRNNALVIHICDSHNLYYAKNARILVFSNNLTLLHTAGPDNLPKLDYEIDPGVTPNRRIVDAYFTPVDSPGAPYSHIYLLLGPNRTEEEFIGDYGAIADESYHLVESTDGGVTWAELSSKVFCPVMSFDISSTNYQHDPCVVEVTQSNYSINFDATLQKYSVGAGGGRVHSGPPAYDVVWINGLKQHGSVTCDVRVELKRFGHSATLIDRNVTEVNSDGVWSWPIPGYYQYADVGVPDYDPARPGDSDHRYYHRVRANINLSLHPDLPQLFFAYDKYLGYELDYSVEGHAYYNGEGVLIGWLPAWQDVNNVNYGWTEAVTFNFYLFRYQTLWDLLPSGDSTTGITEFYTDPAMTWVWEAWPITSYAVNASVTPAAPFSYWAFNVEWQTPDNVQHKELGLWEYLSGLVGKYPPTYAAVNGKTLITYELGNYDITKPYNPDDYGPYPTFPYEVQDTVISYYAGDLTIDPSGNRYYYVMAAVSAVSIAIYQLPDPISQMTFFYDKARTEPMLIGDTPRFGTTLWITYGAYWDGVNMSYDLMAYAYSLEGAMTAASVAYVAGTPDYVVMVASALVPTFGIVEYPGNETGSSKPPNVQGL